jgi:hypothetical protein
MGIKFLAEIPYDSKVETAIGNPSELLSTELGKSIWKVAQML